MNRCAKYWPQVLREARYHIGMDAPAAGFMGQIEVESRCDAGVTAFDGGMGLAQFMPATAAEVHEREAALQEIAMQPMPYDPRWSIRAMILYNRWLYARVACRDWHYAWRAYNGGLTAINREIARAASCDYAAVAAACNRRVLRLTKGLLDLCRVNIEYPCKIRQAGRKYAR